MSEIITETLLEMHFHQALVENFANLYGAKFLRLLKPSTQQEVWVGFDQGWVNTSLTTEQLFNELRQTIQGQSSSVNNFYLGYFLQFKSVKRVTRQSKLMPANYNTPYFRSELSLTPNENTKLSQHETLLRLTAVNNANVYYACAMLFDLDEIYEQPNLDRLRLVDVTTSPTGWATNQRYFITFQIENDTNPLWCSDPVQGKSYSIREWLSRDLLSPIRLTGRELSALIQNATTAINGVGSETLRW